MDKIEAYNDDSSDSVQEMEPPKKLPPPIIDLTNDDTVFDEIPSSKNTSNSVSETFHQNNDLQIKPNGDNPSHWTDDMIKFYNDDWGGETHFSVERLQAKMDKDPSLWEVSSRDLQYLRNRRIRSHAKCWNCCQFGHNVYQCKEDLPIPKCYMCGGAGHIEKTCPSAICLTCGNQMSIFVMSCFKCIPESKTYCSRCYLFGHNVINCTDNWRRFHSTTGKLTVDIPSSDQYKSSSDVWCCNCAAKGHNQINCLSVKDISFPESYPYVASYQANFIKDIYTVEGQEPVPSTSACMNGSGTHQLLSNQNAQPRHMRNLSKPNKKKNRKKKKKKNKSNKSFMQPFNTGLF